MRFETHFSVAAGLIVICGICQGGETGDPGALSPALASIPAWTEFRDEVKAEGAALKARASAHNARCANVPMDDTALVSQCQQSQQELTAAISAYQQHLKAYRHSLEWYLASPVISPADLTAQDRRLIQKLQDLAAADHWPAEKRARFAAALLALGLAREDDPLEVEHTYLSWHDLATRPADAGLKMAADAASGSSVFSASEGQQFHHQDCAIFALANASGRPYGVMASAATDAVSRDVSRSDAERQHPNTTAADGGLNGAEVLYLAEKFGQVSVVRPQNFAATLAGGEAVMVNVGRHEVVLTKSFQYGGKSWFEVMDSLQPTTQRVYVSAAELNAKITENGIVYHAEPGNTVPLLR
jgi:hypothetical protein